MRSSNAGQKGIEERDDILHYRMLVSAVGLC